MARLAAGLALLGPTALAAHTVPLERRTARSSPPAGRRLDASPSTAAVASCGNLAYTSVLGIGTPPQEVELVLDTGSADLWVASGFDGAASSSYNDTGVPFSAAYTDGEAVSGSLATDTLLWAGLTVPGFEFAEVSLDNTWSTCGEEAGLLGLGQDALSQTHGPSAFDAVVAANPGLPRMFAIQAPSADGRFGSLTVGGIDEGRYAASSLTWVACVAPATGFWDVPLGSVAVDGEEPLRAFAGLRAIVDTGTSFMHAPAPSVQALAEAVNATCYARPRRDSDPWAVGLCTADAAHDFAAARCDADALEAGRPLTFRLGGGGGEEEAAAAVTLGPRDYLMAGDCEGDAVRDCRGVCWPKAALDNLGNGRCDCGADGYDLNCPAYDLDGGDCAEPNKPAEDECPRAPEDAPFPMCQLAVVAFDDPGTMRLGDAFLRRTYVAFDVASKRVGFAEPDYSTPSPTPAPDVGGAVQTHMPSVAPTVAPTRFRVPDTGHTVVAAVIFLGIGFLTYVSLRCATSPKFGWMCDCCAAAGSGSGGPAPATPESARRPMRQPGSAQMVALKLSGGAAGKGYARVDLGLGDDLDGSDGSSDEGFDDGFGDDGVGTDVGRDDDGDDRAPSKRRQSLQPGAVIVIADSDSSGSASSSDDEGPMVGTRGNGNRNGNGAEVEVVTQARSSAGHALRITAPRRTASGASAKELRNTPQGLAAPGSARSGSGSPFGWAVAGPRGGSPHGSDGGGPILSPALSERGVSAASRSFETDL